MARGITKDRDMSPVTIDDTEHYLQGFLSIAGFLEVAIQAIADKKDERVLKKVYNAKLICDKFIKSIRGF